jgi:hypothetical protein
MQLGLLMAAIAMAAGVAGAGEPSRLAVGPWGGNGLLLEVSDKGSVTLEFPCAHGSIAAAPAIDARGTFDVEGRFAPERPGPTRVGDDATGKLVRYQGTLKGDILTLEVVLGADETLGPFTLQKGKVGRVVKCY